MVKKCDSNKSKYTLHSSFYQLLSDSKTGVQQTSGVSLKQTKTSQKPLKKKALPRNIPLISVQIICWLDIVITGINPILTFFAVRTEKYWITVICIGPSLRSLIRYDQGTIFLGTDCKKGQYIIYYLPAVTQQVNVPAVTQQVTVR